MNYWLYDNVISITKGTCQFLNFYAALLIFSSTNKEKFKNCTLKDFKVDKEAFHKKHILYEFLESYDDMKKKIESQIELYTPLYCKHVKENFRFYNDVKDQCTSEASCGYFNELNDFKGKFSQKGELNYIYEKCKYKETTCNNGSYAEDDVPCLRAKGNPFILPLLGNDPDDIVNILLNVAIISVPIMAIFLILFKEHHERYCPLNRFIGRIRDFNYNNQNFSTIPDLNDIVAENNVALTNIGCAVYRGYTYLAPHNNGDERRDFCNYLNLWLDEQKSISATDNSDDIREKWVLIENLWDKLYEIEDPSRQCERKSKENNASKIKKRMNLMVYCINRNYFKDLCEKSISRKNNVNQTCSLFSEFTNKYYANFYDENKCFDYPLGTDNYGYYISEDCDLNNIAKTFPKFDSNLQSILENDNVRPTMKKCRIHSEVEDEHIEQTEDGAYVPPEHSEPDNALPGSEVDLTESVFRHPGPEVDPAYLQS
ncbi:hypothetical protein PVNG_04752 [Plasmodium vivax North Korean]|uniref:PIR Superfamily Protein n=1 Tax=Plasmodium vivax North Korean TaxID=1035514 RepID=A0A0J9U0E3_PLAVI|nr:hypothetical protein PVNG_04752 [Plasmodium vivax North Korean]